jgi:hypothetical protein
MPRALPALLAPPEVQGFLDSVHIGRYGYAEVLGREGYDNLHFLGSLINDEGECTRLVGLMQMKRPHERAFRAALQNLASVPPKVTEEAGPVSASQAFPSGQNMHGQAAINASVEVGHASVVQAKPLAYVGSPHQVPAAYAQPMAAYAQPMPPQVQVMHGEVLDARGPPPDRMSVCQTSSAQIHTPVVMYPWGDGGRHCRFLAWFACLCCPWLCSVPAFCIEQEVQALWQGGNYALAWQKSVSEYAHLPTLPQS